MIETVIILGVSFFFIWLIIGVVKKDLKAKHEKEIMFLEEKHETQINLFRKSKNKLQTDINILVDETSSEEDKRLIRKHYLNEIEMDNILNKKR
mgnify:CR=1 FL=1